MLGRRFQEDSAVKHAKHDEGDGVGHPLLKAAGLADSVGFHLKLAQAAVWSDLVAALAPFGLRPSHYSALLILRAAPGSRQQDIGEALGIQRPNLVAMIDGLDKRGLLTRTVNPADRRSYALALTAEGAALLDGADAAHRAHEARLAERMGGGDALLPVLRRVTGIGQVATEATSA